VVDRPEDDDDDDDFSEQNATPRSRFEETLTILVEREATRQRDRGNAPQTVAWTDQVRADRRRRHWLRAAEIEAERPDISPDDLADALEPSPTMPGMTSPESSATQRARLAEISRLESTLAGLRASDDPDGDTIAEVESRLGALRATG